MMLACDIERFQHILAGGMRCRGRLAGVEIRFILSSFFHDHNGFRDASIAYVSLGLVRVSGAWPMAASQGLTEATAELYLADVQF